MSRLHSLLHSHQGIRKPGVGRVIMCRPRWWPWSAALYYQPALSGAGWHRVDAGTAERIAVAGSPLEAMAAVRSTR